MDMIVTLHACNATNLKSISSATYAYVFSTRPEFTSIAK